MATTTDYDAPRGNIADLDEDSLEELKTRRTAAQSPLVDSFLKVVRQVARQNSRLI